uniref:Hexosyltransferase n=1 Tax=Ciona savignyi TaxID=51511 RepID=H2Z1X9_CIOSA
QQPLTDRNHFLYVGVLTAQKYLTTRGRAIRHTWAPHVPGKVEFYVGENVDDVDDGAGDALPLVRLQSVQDDVYPPQKKSFLLLKRMYDAYLNSGYQWFMRADDDVYVNTEKLEMFLRRLNSSEPVYLGQTGLGNAEERGRLSLMHGENYCMGGPGMIFSREVLRRVGPHIRECVHQLYSWHEDVEISRCVRRFAGVNCAWSYQVGLGRHGTPTGYVFQDSGCCAPLEAVVYKKWREAITLEASEMQELFYEHYALRKGYIDPYDEPNNPKLHTAMTLHPNKNPAYQVKLHYFMRSQRIQQLMGKVKQLSRDVVELSSRLTSAIDVEHFMLGSPLTLNRFSPRHHADVIEWSFLTDRLLYSAPPRQPRRSLPIDLQLTIRNLVMQVMAMMNSNSRSRGRVIDFKQVGYGYRRVNPLYGAEYVLDLLLVYKRYKGKKMTIPVRRHAYLQQSFGRTEMREDYPINKHMMRAHSNKKAASDQPVGTNGRKPEVDPLNKLRFDSSRSLSDDQGEETVNIIVPLSGRFDTFRSFMTNLENVSLSRGDPVSLLAIIFVGAESEYKLDARRTSELLDNYSKRYPLYDLRQIPINAKFSRGLALEIGASHFSNDSLLFFCDVDVVFDAEFSGKCRANTRRGVRVFYPVLFSSNDPNPRDLVKPRDDHFVIHGNFGHWRSYGYGLLCVYQSDFTATGGFDMTIQGWGLEDVDLVDKFIGVKRKDDQKRMDIMRVVEPSLVHVYHPSHCDPALTENQFRMCQASRASGITSITNLAGMW